MTTREDSAILSAMICKHAQAALLGLALVTGACSAGAEDKSPAAQGPVNNHVEMVLTEKGFEPQNIRVKQGEPVTLVITRKTDKTCATEIVIDDYKINTKLPLDTPVTVTFTPTKTGALKYGCAMQKMVGGVITVQ